MNIEQLETTKNKVLLSMSGGVDSSLSAALLKEQGFEVIGCFIKNWSESKNSDGQCSWKQDRQDAMRVAAQLGIPLVTVDSEDRYREAVVNYLYSEYEDGRTPNPDIVCNEEIKFPVLAAEADRLGCKWIATGHYARVLHNPVRLLRAVDENKDQTYFLYRVDSRFLSRTLFPIGELTKTEVRDEAKKRKLPTAERKESMGICFIGKTNIREFLRKQIPDRPGKIITTKGDVIGSHNGLHQFTLGQRHGLGVGGGEPYFVVQKNTENNELVVTDVENDSALLKKDVCIEDVRWIGNTPELPLEVGVRIRHRQPLIQVKIFQSDNGNLNVRFSEPVRAVAPGQSAVFYEDNSCLGGGIITSAKTC